MRPTLSERLVSALATYEPWTNVYGLARSMLAFATAATLAANSPTTLFRPGAGALDPPFCAGARIASAFCVLPRAELDVARWVCVAVLLVVASGWRPRWTALLHWWVTASLPASALMIEGGDQAAEILALLMLPIAFTDERRWHWGPPLRTPLDQTQASKRIWAALGHALIRLQVAGIYFHAAIGKLAVPEWKDGTALYYWGTQEAFGAPAWVMPVFRPILIHGATVAALTWSVILLELALSVAFLMERKYQPPLMWAGITMHLGIIVVHGLPSFGLIMVAALVLYLRPLGTPLQWPVALAAKLAHPKVGLTDRPLSPAGAAILGEIAGDPPAPGLPRT
jgi:antimicrobial peptide system SdpB family protein